MRDLTLVLERGASRRGAVLLRAGAAAVRRVLPLVHPGGGRVRRASARARRARCFAAPAPPRPPRRGAGPPPARRRVPRAPTHGRRVAAERLPASAPARSSRPRVPRTRPRARRALPPVAPGL